MRAAICRDVVSVLERARDEWGSKPLVASGSVSFSPSQYLDVDRMPGPGEGCVRGTGEGMCGRRQVEEHAPAPPA